MRAAQAAIGELEGLEGPALKAQQERICVLIESANAQQAIQYFIDDCRDDTLLKHKLMRQEPSTLMQLMAVVDQYAMAESSMKFPVIVDGAGKPTVSKPVSAPAAGRSQPDQGKRKVDQPDAR
ncbi:endoglucanase 3 [Hordeum vulgare]|nr:endoglucanase 3 [Hordeum vulgare]